jgi:hypothetical protein
MPGKEECGESFDPGVNLNSFAMAHGYDDSSADKDQGRNTSKVQLVELAIFCCEAKQAYRNEQYGAGKCAAGNDHEQDR